LSAFAGDNFCSFGNSGNIMLTNDPKDETHFDATGSLGTTEKQCFKACAAQATAGNDSSSSCKYGLSWKKATVRTCVVSAGSAIGSEKEITTDLPKQLIYFEDTDKDGNGPAKFIKDCVIFAKNYASQQAGPAYVRAEVFKDKTKEEFKEFSVAGKNTCQISAEDGYKENLKPKKDMPACEQVCNAHVKGRLSLKMAEELKSAIKVDLNFDRTFKYTCTFKASSTATPETKVLEYRYGKK